LKTFRKEYFCTNDYGDTHPNYYTGEESNKNTIVESNSVAGPALPPPSNELANGFPQKAFNSSHYPD
jgi:hypothetical protein